MLKTYNFSSTQPILNKTFFPHFSEPNIRCFPNQPVKGFAVIFSLIYWLDFFYIRVYWKIQLELAEVIRIFLIQKTKMYYESSNFRYG